jgi:hypothetical protein
VGSRHPGEVVARRVSWVQRNLTPYQPNLDALQEMKVITNNASAEFGNFQGGVVMVMKSGTNQFHGTLFEQFRNDKLNANSWYRNWSGVPRLAMRWNQFGGTLGGRIAPNRLFCRSWLNRSSPAITFFWPRGTSSPQAITTSASLFSARNPWTTGVGCFESSLRPWSGFRRHGFVAFVPWGTMVRHRVHRHDIRHKQRSRRGIHPHLRPRVGRGSKREHDCRGGPILRVVDVPHHIHRTWWIVGLQYFHRFSIQWDPRL